MAIEVTNGGTVITGEHIHLFRLKTLLRAMELEVKTGMKMCRVNPFNIVRSEFGIKARKKADVLAQFSALLSENGIA